MSVSRYQLATKLKVSIHIINKFSVLLGLVGNIIDCEDEGTITEQVKRYLQKNKRGSCNHCGKNHRDSECIEVFEERKCTSCNATKKLNEFYCKRKGSKQFNYICRECLSQRAKEKYRTLEGRALSLVRAAKNRSSGDIDVEWVIASFKSQKGKCYYSGIDMNFTGGNYAFSIDRVDNTKGYTRDNSVLCCWIINDMKRDYPVSEFLKICKKINES